MSSKSIKEFNQGLVGDCKLSIEQFYADTAWEVYPRPYTVLSDYDDPSQSYRIMLPPGTEDMDRPTQYYMLSRAVSAFRVSRVGIVAYLELEVPSRPELEPRFWERKARAALIGAAGRVESFKTSISYDTKVLIFDIIDEELVFCDIEDQSIWQDFINNVALFRDYLFMSAVTSPRTPYRWPELVQSLRRHGFEFNFSSSENETNFLRSQEALIAL